MLADDGPGRTTRWSSTAGCSRSTRSTSAPGCGWRSCSPPTARADAALAAFAEAQRLAPDDPDVYEREGRALLFAGKKRRGARGAAAVARAAPAEPGAQGGAAHAARRRHGGRHPLGLRSRSRCSTRRKANVQDEDAVYLADVTAVRVQTVGLSSRFQQLVVKVLDPARRGGVPPAAHHLLARPPGGAGVEGAHHQARRRVVDSYGDEDRAQRAVDRHVLRRPGAGAHLPRARARRRARGAVAARRHRRRTTCCRTTGATWTRCRALYPKLHYLYVVDMPKSARALLQRNAPLPKWVTHEADRRRRAARCTASRRSDVPKVVPEP